MRKRFSGKGPVIDMRPQSKSFENATDSFRLNTTWRFFKGLPRRVIAFLFGDDVFVSYARGDGVTYAAGLASKLTKAGFSCFLDQWSCGQGEKLPKHLVRAVKRSSAFVLLATKQSLDSQAILEELQAFSDKQPLILVQLTDSLDGGKWTHLVAGVAKTIDIPLNGRARPSRETVDRIINSFRTRSRNKRLRTTFFIVLALTVVLIGVSSWFTVRFAADAAIAEKTRAVAVVQSLAAAAAYGSAEKSRGPEAVVQLAAESVLRSPTPLASQVLLDNAALMTPTLFESPIPERVGAIAFTSTGVRATILAANRIDVVDVGSGHRTQSIDAAPGPSLPALSGDGTYIAAVVPGGALLWSSEAGMRVRRLELPDHLAPNAVALSRDASTLIATGAPFYSSFGPLPSTQLAICDGRNHSPCHFKTYPNTFINAAISPDGTELAVAGSDFVEVIRRDLTGTPKRLPLNASTRVPWAQGTISCSGACEKVALVSSGSVVLWDTRAKRTIIIGTAGVAHDTQLSMDGARLATISWVRSAALLQVWDTFAGTEIARMVDPFGIDAIAFDAAGRKLAFAVPGQLRIADLEGSALRPLSVKDTVFTLTASRDARQWAIGTFGDIAVFDRNKNAFMQTNLGRFAVEDLAIVRDGRHLVLGGGKLISMRPSGGFDVLVDFGARGEGSPYVGANRLSPDGRLYLTTGGRTLRVRETLSDRIVLGPLSLDEDIVASDFSLDAAYVAAAGEKYTRVWSLLSKEVNEIPGRATFLALGNGGRRIARSTGDSRAEVIDVATGKTIFTIEDPNPRRRVPLIQFRFNEDATKLYVPMIRSGLSEFDVSSGMERQLFVLTTNPDPTPGERNPVVISRDARFVAWANGNSVRIAPIDAGELAREACRQVVIPITTEEWSSLAPGEPNRLCVPIQVSR